MNLLLARSRHKLRPRFSRYGVEGGHHRLGMSISGFCAKADTLFFQPKDIGDTLWQREPLKR